MPRCDLFERVEILMDMTVKDQVPELVILYDGECPLCNSTVRYVIRHDHNKLFHFAPLGSQFSSALLSRYGEQDTVPDSVILVENGKLMFRTEAVNRIMDLLPGWWRMFRWIRYIPRKLRDSLYDLVARHRKKFRMNSARCDLPPPEDRFRFHFK